jgi:hypothetical protein
MSSKVLVLSLGSFGLAVLILKPVRSEIFVVKILGTGVALEIDHGSVAKVIPK